MFSWWSQPENEPSESGAMVIIEGVKYESNEVEDNSLQAIIQRTGDTFEIDIESYTYSVSFLAGGKHIVSMDKEEKIRRWRVEGGTEVGIPIHMKDNWNNLTVSRDEKWVAGGSYHGEVMLWSMEKPSKMVTLNTLRRRIDVSMVDISPDGSKIAIGSTAYTAWVISLSTGKELLGPLKHGWSLAAVRFAPNGRYFATATWERDSIRIYDSQDGRILLDIPVCVAWCRNQSLVWASDSRRLFVLSSDGNINCLNVRSGATLSRWPIHSSVDPKCIVLASNDMFIATSANSSVSLWDTTTHQQIGSVINYSYIVGTMAMSVKYDLVVGGEKITLRRLRDFLPTSYADVIFPERAVQRIKAEKAVLEDTLQSLRTQEETSSTQIAYLEQTVQELRHDLSESRKENKSIVQSLRTQESSSNSKIANLEKTVQELRNKLANSQRTASQQKDSLNETIKSLRADLQAQTTQTKNLNAMQNAMQELRSEVSEFRRKADREKNNLSMSIESLRSDLSALEETLSMKMTQLDVVKELCVQVAQVGSSHSATT